MAGEALLRVNDQTDGKKPLLERKLRLLEDGSRQDIEAGFAVMAIESPQTVAVRLAANARASATRATGFIAPPKLFKML